VLAELEADGTAHLSLVYRGVPEKAQEFIRVQDEVIAKIYHSELVETTVEENAMDVSVENSQTVGNTSGEDLAQ
jgi:pilus assembly protein CpaB